jgi:hypothetical protein
MGHRSGGQRTIEVSEVSCSGSWSGDPTRASSVMDRGRIPATPGKAAASRRGNERSR